MPQGVYERPNAIKPGDQFSDWTVVTQSANLNGLLMWLCRCKCGHERVVRGSNLRTGISRGCGCVRIYKFLGTVTRHGQSTSALYKVWTSMHQRCRNPRSQGWANYGARGIRVDERWDDFTVFVADMGPRPQGMSLERINNDGNYTPANVRWASAKEQANNNRRNHTVTLNGETQTVSQWAQQLQMDKRTLLARLRLGWTAERALTTPPGKYVKSIRV